MCYDLYLQWYGQRTSVTFPTSSCDAMQLEPLHSVRSANPSCLSANGRCGAKKRKAHTKRLTSKNSRKRISIVSHFKSAHCGESGCSALDDNEDASTDTKPKLRTYRHRIEWCNSQETSEKVATDERVKESPVTELTCTKAFTARRPTLQQHVVDVGQDSAPTPRAHLQTSSCVASTKKGIDSSN